MNLSREDLEWAAAHGHLGPQQVEPLWTALSTRGDPPSASRFDMAHVAYYFGALIVIGAMGFFMTLGWESFGGGGIFAIALAYAGVFLLVGRSLWRRPEAERMRVPAGLLITMAVCMTPLATYGLERALGLWAEHDPGSFRDFHAYVNSGWLWMELETIAASLIALRFFRFPFLTAPMAFVLWYLSMDLGAAFSTGGYDYADRCWTSVAVGLVMIGIAYLVDRRTKEDYAYWLYLFGLMAFWGGLSSMESSSELRRFGYLVLNCGLIVVSVMLARRVFLVFGAFGVFGYLSFEAWHVFEDSILFPFVLSGIGLFILFGAVKYTRNRAAIDAWAERALPSWARPRARSA